MPALFWTPAAHADRRPFLTARANILRAVRAWFEGEGFIEVEPAMLVASPGAETHLDAFAVEGRFLHTSPEFALKKLLAAGETKIFSLGKVWRRGEAGPLHAPEFTMLEWYRAQAPYTEIMADCLALLRLACETVGAPALTWRGQSCDPLAPAQRLTLGEAFAECAGFRGDLYASEIGYFAANGFASRAGESWSDLFSRVLVEKIEHRLGMPAPTLLYDYPIAEAALAQPNPADPRRAERFELYACGVELANGFGELTDTIEQRARLTAAMAEKQARYGQSWPLDEDFLAALAHMPPASGVALGFDRLVMLAAGARHIQDVLWTPSS
jgi:elongation factor P--(R)-beta-lysine ligase